MNGQGRTFAEASKQIEANLQRHLDRQASQAAGSSGHDSSSQDEDDDDEASQELLQKITAQYGQLDRNDRTFRAILQTFRSNENACLICISTIKRNDRIWNCDNCHYSMHISCVHQWSNQSIMVQKDEAENDRDPRKKPPVLRWGCPNCRQEYLPAQVPRDYFCYCGKTRDPEFDPWIVPHSCGEICNRALDPKCGHSCKLLCHPGPCPPCPKMVTHPCHCGNSAPATRRCHVKHWSCPKPCSKPLNCGQHPCPLTCHEGPCKPCSKTSVQLCNCQRHQQKRECAEPVWQCEDRCNKPLKCGHHICDIVCHKGTCPPCPLSEIRKCPCGKTEHKLPCTLATPTCGDTCGKMLGCGKHVCAERCHRGTCGNCLQMVVKSCRCGLKKKEVPCMREYTCETKCKSKRDCRKHACNRKCCDGNCPPCEQLCGKQLSCKNHKCVSPCHTGSCYPCNQTKEVSCNCNSSRTLVPCGREKTTSPPKCRQKCKKPPECHHEQRTVHACHFGECPTCKQTCNTKLKCSHICPAPCHDRVKVKALQAKKAAVPWEERAPVIETKALSCPDCLVPVSVTCLGAHDTSNFACYMAKPASCGRQCGRALQCGNHACARDCHKVRQAPNTSDAGANCRKCELECTVARPEGCTHPCPKPCHQGACDTCKQNLKITCHCGLSQLYVKCGEWNLATDDSQDVKEKRDQLACCQNQCPKPMSCGHRCSKTCHAGDCSDPGACRKRTKLYCQCKRRKEEIPCSKLSSEDKSSTKSLSCDAECAKIKSAAEEERMKAERAQKEEEERVQREELERFEKKLEGKKRRRNRKFQSETQDQNQGILGKHKSVVLGTVFCTIIAVFIGFYVMGK